MISTSRKLTNRQVDFTAGLKKEAGQLIESSRKGALVPAILTPITEERHSSIGFTAAQIPVCEAQANQHLFKSLILGPSALTAGQLIELTKIINLNVLLPASGVTPASTTPYSDYSKHGWPRDKAITGYTLVHAGDRTHGLRSLVSLLRPFCSEELRGRFTAAIFNSDPYAYFASDDCRRFPPARMEIVDQSLRESSQPWNHFQLDSLGLMTWVFFKLHNEKVFSLPGLSRAILKNGAPFEDTDSIFCVWLKALAKSRYYQQADFGPWEDYREERRGTSIGACVAAFREAKTFFESTDWNGLNTSCKVELRDIVQEGLERGVEVLHSRIPLDGSYAIDNDRFKHDASLSFLLLADPGLSRAQQDAIIKMIYTYRLGEIGVTRRDEDAYLGSDYAHRHGNEGVWADLASSSFRSAEWGIFDCILGDFLFNRGSKTGSFEDLELAERHLRRALLQVTPRQDRFLRANDGVTVEIPAFSIPEAYWFDSKVGTWRANHNTPLLMGLGAFSRMLQSAFRAKVAVESGEFFRQAA